MKTETKSIRSRGKKVIVSKENGGLGVGYIRALNIALTVKWWWRLKSEPSSLWGRVITGIHNLHKKTLDYLSKKSSIGVRNNIVGDKKKY